jgi:hypothetical protein
VLIHRSPQPALGPLARRTPLLTVLAVAAALVPATAAAELGGQGAPGPSGCSSIGVASASGGGGLNVSGSATVTCSYPTGSRFSSSDHPSPTPLGTPGDKCTNTSYQPFVWTEGPTTFEGQGGYLPGGVAKDPNGREVAYSAREGLASGYDPGTHDWYDVYTETSKYGPDGICIVDPNGWQETQFLVVPHAIAGNPGDVTGQILTLIDQFRARLHDNPAKIGTLPAQTQGLVNLAQCFWLDGLQPDQFATATLFGPPDVTGRSVVYSLVLHATLGQVQWQYGDETGGAAGHVASIPAQCGNHPQEVAHDYVRISGANTDFQVTATQSWNITANLFWVDSAGVGSAVIPVNQPTATVTSGPLPVYIGQLEGVPSA